MQGTENSQPLSEGQKRHVLRRFAAKLCISTTLVIGLLVAGECAAYVFMLHRHGGFKYEYKSYVIWRAVPDEGPTITVEADGLRRTMYSRCDDNDYTIWMLGGSGLWGTFNRDSETIASLLAKKYEESSRQVCVRNYGQEGWASTQEVIELLLELKRAKRKPDVVIFYDGSVDSYLPYESNEVDAHVGFPRFKKNFESWRQDWGFGYLRQTNTYLALQRISRALMLNMDSGPPSSLSAEEVASKAERALDNYLQNMKVVDILAMHYGFHYVCFWEPWILTSQKQLTASEELIKHREESHNPAATEVMRATYDLFRGVKQPHLVFLGDEFKDHPERLFADASHLEAEGNRLVAERIFQVLQHLVS
jgi:hypothetical protein